MIDKAIWEHPKVGYLRLSMPQLSPYNGKLYSLGTKRTPHIGLSNMLRILVTLPKANKVLESPEGI